jgi:hypothetical protein
MSTRITYRYYDNGKLDHQDIGYKNIPQLVTFLSNAPSITNLAGGTCLPGKWYSFDSKRFFYCASPEFLSLILTKHSTIVFIQKTVPLGSTQYLAGNLACYTEEQINTQDYPGAMLEMPNEMDRFLNELRKYTKGNFPAAKPVFQFVLNFEDLLEGNIEVYIAYDESSDNVILGRDTNMYILGNYDKIVHYLNQSMDDLIDLNGEIDKQTDVTIFNIIRGVFLISVIDVSIVAVGLENVGVALENPNHDDVVRSSRPDLFDNEDYARRSIKNIPECIYAVVKCKSFH